MSSNETSWRGCELLCGQHLEWRTMLILFSVCDQRSPVDAWTFRMITGPCACIILPQGPRLLRGVFICCVFKFGPGDTCGSPALLTERSHPPQAMGEWMNTQRNHLWRLRALTASAGARRRSTSVRRALRGCHRPGRRRRRHTRCASSLSSAITNDNIPHTGII